MGEISLVDSRDVARSTLQRRRIRPAAFAALSLVYAATLAACGGGGGSSMPPLPPPNGSPPPQAPSTSVPFAAVGQQLPLPGVANYSESITVPANNESGTNTTFTVSLSTQPITPLSKVRRPLGVSPFTIVPSGGTTLLDFDIESPVNATFDTLPGFQVSIPQGTTGQNYYMALWDPTTSPPVTWQSVGQLSVNGSTVTFAGGPMPLNLLAGVDAEMAVFSEPVASPTPSSPARIYVANPGNNTVTMYDQVGDVLNPTGGFPNLMRPYGITYDSANDHLYVFNTYSSTNVITIYDKNGAQIIPSGSFPNAFGASIAFDSANDEIYVANLAENSITVYDQNGNQITTSGSFPSLNNPQSMAFDSNNDEIYVLNGSPNDNITVYDQSGNQITPTGLFPVVPLCGPSGIAYDSENHELYMTNIGCETVSVFDQQGNPITPSGAFQGLDCPQSVAFDSANNDLYVTDDGVHHICEVVNGGSITVYDQNGNEVITTGNFPNLSDPAFSTVAPF